MAKYFFGLLFTIFGTALMAQEFGYGFRAGLSFNTLISDSETDANGTELESFTSNTGFHVGAIFTWKATDLMGARAEFIYTQKGGRRTFKGPSYYTFTTTTDKEILTTGTRELNLNLTSSYFEFPITGYVKPLEWLEVYGGVSAGFMVASNVFGNLKYTDGQTSNGIGFDAIDYEIDGNYNTDNINKQIFRNPVKTISIGNETVEVPNSVGVYYEFEKDPGRLYKTFELGAVGGISVYLNKGLFVSGRVNYGLTDITKTNADVSLAKLENGKFIKRDDKDRNFSIQASIGFSF
ncbi:MAG TPA: hypothetical protein ENJ95_00560 [Bacteroidetes bacterium]|nr:hypothetical protein [Bacteroidota bacterium]